MPRYKIILEYDGSWFRGFQRQENAPSVQQTLEEAIEAFAQQPVRLHVAGRTDAGVHALGQVCHFDLAKAVGARTVMRAGNFYLREKGVIIVKAEEVSESFHARFSARARAYTYCILNRPAPPTLSKGRVWHIPKPLDAEKMQQAATVLIGTHDFNTFRATQCQAKSSIRTLEYLKVQRKGDHIFISTRARSFLHHQVRNMVGTLQWVGSGYWSYDQLCTAFHACDRTKGGPTAPAEGLYFTRVYYAEDDLAHMEDILPPSF